MFSLFPSFLSQANPSRWAPLRMAFPIIPRYPRCPPPASPPPLLGRRAEDLVGFLRSSWGGDVASLCLAYVFFFFLRGALWVLSVDWSFLLFCLCLFFLRLYECWLSFSFVLLIFFWLCECWLIFSFVLLFICFGFMSVDWAFLLFCLFFLALWVLIDLYFCFACYVFWLYECWLSFSFVWLIFLGGGFVSVDWAFLLFGLCF